MNFTDLKLYAGATWNWTESLDEYPASEYDLVLYLKNGTNAAVPLSASQDGDDFEFDLTANTTNQFTKKKYTYQFVVSKAGEVDIIETGEVYIYAILNLASDLRTHEEIVLDAIKSLIESRATKEQSEISFGDKTLEYLTPQELEYWKSVYERKVEQIKRQRAGKTGTPRILESF